jgi:hypothetical protein
MNGRRGGVVSKRDLHLIIDHVPSLKTVECADGNQLVAGPDRRSRQARQFLGDGEMGDEAVVAVDGGVADDVDGATDCARA